MGLNWKKKTWMRGLQLQFFISCSNETAETQRKATITKLELKLGSIQFEARSSCCISWLLLRFFSPKVHLAWSMLRLYIVTDCKYCTDNFCFQSSVHLTFQIIWIAGILAVWESEKLIEGQQMSWQPSGFSMSSIQSFQYGFIWAAAISGQTEGATSCTLTQLKQFIPQLEEEAIVMISIILLQWSGCPFGWCSWPNKSAWWCTQ